MTGTAGLLIGTRAAVALMYSLRAIKRKRRELIRLRDNLPCDGKDAILFHEL